MGAAEFPSQLKDLPVFMVGVKGSGMAALAEVLVRAGAQVSGSDTSEVFYTDAILERLRVPVHVGFDAQALPTGVEVVIHSAAYDPETTPQLSAARDRGIPTVTYTEALGALSRGRLALGVSGVHGKTTTTAMIGALVKHLHLSGTVLVGSAAADFDGMSTYSGGQDFFVAETCEYRRHFLDFHPDIIIVTSVEPDHLDYYRDYEDILGAFVSYAQKLPDGGELIYCADDEGACEVARAAANERPDLLRIPYGLAAEGPFGITELTRLPGRTRFSLRGWDQPFALRVPGDHNAVNAAAALCAVSRLALHSGGMRGPTAAGAGAEAAAGAAGAAGAEAAAEAAAEAGRGPEADALAPSLDHAEAAAALERFSGTRRRSEVIGEAAGVLFLDDYGHHPTAIKKTLAGLRSFYPDRRIVVDFMSHTYSRTAALLEEFGACFGHADEVILHEIYASARENYDGSITGEDLAREVSRRHRHVRYIEKVAGAGGEIAEVLEPGDLFITMGAGNNWTLSHELFHSFSREPAET